MAMAGGVAVHAAQKNSNQVRQLPSLVGREHGPMPEDIPATATRTNFGVSWSDIAVEDAHWLLGHGAFQGMIMLAIAANGIQMGVETFLDNPSEIVFLAVLEHTFLIVFVFEMVIKIVCMGKMYVCDSEVGSWNMLDFLIVWVAILDMWIIPMLGSRNSSLSFIKVFRLLRLLRILKLVHNVPELKMVIEGMIASMRSMVWIVLLLLAVMYILGILCVETIGREPIDVYPGRSESADKIDLYFVDTFNNYVYFGDLWRSLVTLFGLVLLAEWSSIVRPVWETQPYLIIIFCMLIFITTFGIFNVIIGIVVERTNQAMEQVRMDTAEAKVRKRMLMVEEMANIAFHLDEDMDGVVSHQEMEAIEGNAHFQYLLKNVELPHGFTFSELHQMFDHDGSNDLTKTEFVVGMLRLVECNPFQQACLHQWMLAQVKTEIHKVQSQMKDLITTVLLPEITGIKLQINDLSEAMRCPSRPQTSFERAVGSKPGAISSDHAHSMVQPEELSGVWMPLPEATASHTSPSAKLAIQPGSLEAEMMRFPQSEFVAMVDNTMAAARNAMSPSQNRGPILEVPHNETGAILDEGGGRTERVAQSPAGPSVEDVPQRVEVPSSACYPCPEITDSTAHSWI